MTLDTSREPPLHFYVLYVEIRANRYIRDIYIIVMSIYDIGIGKIYTRHEYTYSLADK